MRLIDYKGYEAYGGYRYMPVSTDIQIGTVFRKLSIWPVRAKSLESLVVDGLWVDMFIKVIGYLTSSVRD